MKIIKQQIIKNISQKMGFSQRLTYLVIEELLEEIKKNLELKRKVKISRFGSFVPKIWRKRKVRDIKRGKPIIMERCPGVTFHLSIKFREFLREVNFKDNSNE